MTCFGLELKKQEKMISKNLIPKRNEFEQLQISVRVISYLPLLSTFRFFELCVLT